MKDCHVNSQTFLIYLRAIDLYLQVPFDGVTAFPNGYDTNLNIEYPTSTAGYEPKSANSSMNDCELHQELWKQININVYLENKINTLKKEVDDSRDRIRVMSKSNTDMISKITRKKSRTICLEKDQETKIKDNYKKRNSTLTVENYRMKDIKADMKHLQQIQVDIDVQRADAIQRLVALDKKQPEN